jgi:hypothetical protein
MGLSTNKHNVWGVVGTCILTYILIEVGRLDITIKHTCPWGIEFDISIVVVN